MRFFDRLKQSFVDVESINKPVEFSRYLNSFHEFVVPCDILTESITDEFIINFDANKFINNNRDLISHSFIEISEELSLINTIDDIADIIPMLRNFDERLKINDFDHFIHEHLFHLEEICRQPAYHLSREETKVNISRAKRITVKSINHLAAHSEDWSRRRIRGVEPKNILSETIEYDLQIYENKVTSKLIDKLLKYCSNRILNDIEVVENFEKKISGIVNDMKVTENQNFWYQKRYRDYHKISSLLKTIENSMHQLDILKTYILKIQNRLFSLLISDLYISNKNSILSNDNINRTNLFDSHQHYRYVKMIWNKSFSIESLSCEEVKSNNKSIINAFVDFSLLLILRSLAELGFTNLKQISTEKYKLSHEQYSLDIDIYKDIHSIIEININDDIIKFIPLLSELHISDIELNPNEHILSPFKINFKNSIQITPDDINSEERITKILFNKFLKKYASHYLYYIDSQLISQFKILEDWFLTQGTIVVNKGHKKKLELYVKKYISESEYRVFEEIIREQKNNLPQHQTRNIQLKDLDKIGQLLLESRKHFEKYFICLGCGTKNINALQSLDNGFTYVCNNSGCEVKYGTINNKVFYEVKNLVSITGDLDDKIGYENIHEE